MSLFSTNTDISETINVQFMFWHYTVAKDAFQCHARAIYAFVGMILLVLVKCSPYTITESCWFSLSIRLELIPALSHLAVAVVYAN